MNHYDFQDQVAVITGGAKGIGMSIARRLAESGARVVIWDRHPTAPEETLGNERGHAVLEVDVGDYRSVQRALDSTLKIGGGVDVLVNSAGVVGPDCPLWEYPLDQWERVQRVNLDGTFYACRAVVPEMIRRGYGRVLNIASIAGKEGNANGSAYSAAKAAVIAMTKSLGKELAGHDIAVNCITPAAAKTDLMLEMSEDYIAAVLAKIPRGRFVTVEEIAALSAWLCSRENSFTTGAAFDISGGRATY
ncbi:SDR family NAD(P)-dependent oxidoreductase [Halomonas heilongjiangensis]|uniref:3-oxoacyl-ACP reductase n=1 Tax=Halomonas heilongjiangensis TaxID=1387883 RepID=A0A2N7TH40_9GAMM|nr:SDR family NAD(P)-dependent oxidoreductase [Halomonas heilongjiangensis]PMR67496.1 3-oxoacyl-ACP reductase [Halomonas heilongjiangensis]PXX87060.1 3-oxoacyl-ACP reductase [Halomonas heilongjiangensis]